jgi:Ca-activated chloride channel family protein
MSSRHPRSTAVRLTLATLLTAAGLATIVTPSHAEPQDKQTTPTMIILDASGSMLTNDAPGPRIDAAKGAIRQLVSGLPSNASIGLTVYGTGTSSSGAEKEAGCRDVKTIVPLGPLDKEKFTSTVDGITPSGFTPIGEALREAARQLPKEGPRAIVLVSDGIDTCAPPPPCDVAKELVRDGMDLTVHTVGFKVDAKARADLQCIAASTGGRYSDAKDAKQLDKALEQQVRRAIRTYDTMGTPVTGADSRNADDIPLLTPGQWVETLPPIPVGTDFTERYYKIQPEGWTPHIAVTGVFPFDAQLHSGSSPTLEVKALTPDGDACGSDTGFGSGVASRKGAPLVASFTPSCKDEDEIIVKTTRKDSTYNTSPMTVELVVRFEPPSDISQVPAREERPEPTPPAINDEAQDIEGGSSFNSASEIEPGKTYSSSVSNGEYIYFKIPMTWGQQLSARFRQGTLSGATKTGWFTFDADLYDPMRNHIKNRSEFWYKPGAGESADVRLGTKEVLRATSYTMKLDGHYYLMIHGDISSSAKGESALQDFQFTVVTPGEIEDGPIYQPGDRTPFTPPPSEEPTSTGPTESTEPSGNQGSEPSSGILSWMLWPAVGLGGVLVIGGIVTAVLLIRRRK